MGKDEKLRLRFDSSEARERYRRQRPEGRGALAPSNPSPPPSLHVLPSLFHLRYAIFCPTGKDEKLRLRFDSSEARERCRRQRPEGRGAIATSYPLPHHHLLKNTSIQLLYDILYSAPRGRMRSFDQGSTRAKRENVAAGNGPKARRFSAE